MQPSPFFVQFVNCKQLVDADKGVDVDVAWEVVDVVYLEAELG